MHFPQIAAFTPTSLVLASDSCLINNYRAVSKLIGGRVHKQFNLAIADFDFLKITVFNNNYLKIPPVETFLVYYGAGLPSLSDEEKRGIGAMFGNLFKFVLGYANQERKQYRNFIVGSAQYFYK
ncbi:hypothetical protein [Bacillus sp. FJAT-27245]|uniref:hypothetical protein n=1 Tax=Bacillus sp. FJAT-27245 TaxID=1684144 RepID=UPI0006A7902D|nr:hypothetical protein [Bacillus sp. FJAT-27245]